MMDCILNRNIFFVYAGVHHVEILPHFVRAIQVRLAGFMLQIIFVNNLPNINGNYVGTRNPNETTGKILT